MGRARNLAGLWLALLLAAGAAPGARAAGAAGAAGAEYSVKALLRMLKSGSSKRILAIRLIQEKPAEELRRQLAVELLKDIAADRSGNTTVRTRILEALGNIATGKLPEAKRTVVRITVKILGSRADKLDVRTEAARVLGTLCTGEAETDKAGRKILGKVATDVGEEAELRAQVLEAIGRIAHADSLPVVEQSLEDDDPDVKKAAREAARGFNEGMKPVPSGAIETS